MKQVISINHLRYLGNIFNKTVRSKEIYDGEIRKAVDIVIERINKNRFKKLTKEKIYNGNYSVDLINDVEKGVVTFRIVHERETIVGKYPLNKKVEHDVVIEETYKAKYNQ